MPNRLFDTRDDAIERFLLVSGLTGLVDPGSDVAASGVLEDSGGFRLAADMRGARGVKGVRPYFTTVDMVIEIETDESEKRLELLRRNVEQRCPVMNLFESADVEMNVIWKTRSRQQGAA